MQTKTDVPLIQQVADTNSTDTASECVIAIPEKALVMQRTARGVARNEKLEGYLNNILKKIQKAWPEKNIPSHVFLTPSAEFSAFYSDGGIFIAHGMLSEMESEDEIAACLAHEYSHALLRHDTLAVGSQFASHLYGVANMYLQVKYGHKGVSGELFEQYLLNQALNEAAQSALLPAFSREQEDAADALGTDLLIRAGYNPIAMTYLLQRVEDWETRNQKKAEENEIRFTKLFKSETPSKTQEPAKQIDISLNKVVNEISNDLAKAYKELQRQHYPASEREMKVKEYIREYYAEVPRDFLQHQELNSIMRDKGINRFLAGLKRLEKSDQACYAKDTKTAKKHISVAYRVLHDDVAYARHISFEVSRMTRAGKVEQLEKSCQEPDSLLRDHETLIRHYESKEPEKALQLANETFKEFNKPTWMLPTLVRLHKRLDHDLIATAYYVACMASGDPQVLNMCGESLK